MVLSSLYPKVTACSQFFPLLEKTAGTPDRHIYRLTDRGNEVMLHLMRDFSPEMAKREAKMNIAGVLLSQQSSYQALHPTAFLRYAAIANRRAGFADCDRLFLRWSSLSGCTLLFDGRLAHF